MFTRFCVAGGGPRSSSARRGVLEQILQNDRDVILQTRLFLLLLQSSPKWSPTARFREPFDIPVFTKARISSEWLKTCDFVVLVVTSNMIHASFRVSSIRGGGDGPELAFSRWKGTPNYWLQCQSGIGLHATALNQVETMANGKWDTQSKINAPGAWRYFRWSDPGFRTAATAWG
jgi:hypothetical protein